jgi:hypothetical protein
VKPLIAAAAAFVLAAAAAIVFLLNRHTDTGPDAFAGAYPLVTAAPTGQPALTWHPTGSPAGPLPVFSGTGSRVIGRTTNRFVGLSFARLGQPWRQTSRTPTDPAMGQQFGSSRHADLAHFWYATISVKPLDPKFDAPGPQRLRAAAELTGQGFAKELYLDEGRRTDLAGAALTIDHHPGWVTAFRMIHTDGTRRVEKGQTEVVVAVDTGRPALAIVEITVPSNQSRVLPDINHVVRSLRVVR